MERKTILFFQLHPKIDSKIKPEYKNFPLLFCRVNLNQRNRSHFICLSSSFALDTSHLECIFIICLVNILTFETMFLFLFLLQPCNVIFFFLCCCLFSNRLISCQVFAPSLLFGLWIKEMCVGNSLEHSWFSVAKQILIPGCFFSY